MDRQDLHRTARERLLEGLPVRRRGVAVDGVDTSVLEGGEGPPLVLLHGGSQAGGVLDHGEWHDTLDAYVLSRAVLPHVKRTMRQLVRAGTAEIPDSDLRRIAVPTTLLWGSGDRMAPLPLAEAASARLGWPLRLIDDAGHLPHVERPEAFVAALEQAIDVH